MRLYITRSEILDVYQADKLVYNQLASICSISMMRLVDHNHSLTFVLLHNKLFLTNVSLTGYFRLHGIVLL
jgi:hypothetical protein